MGYLPLATTTSPQRAGCPLDGYRLVLLDHAGQRNRDDEPGRADIVRWQETDDY